MCPVTAIPTFPAPGQRRRRYPSDTTDAEWALLEALLPLPACSQARGGRSEAHPRREVIDAIRYLVHNGCVWRALPADFPPWRTVYGFFARWRADGTLDRAHDALRDQIRVATGCKPQPSAAIIDSQSVRAADTVSRTSRGFDAGYAGKLVVWAAATLGLRVDIVRRRLAHAFQVPPRRWVVERTFAWISRHRRTVRDYERLPDHHRAMVTWAMITVMTRRLARQHRPAAPQPSHGAA